MTEISLSYGVYSCNLAAGTSTVKNCTETVDLAKVNEDNKVVVYIDHSDDAVDINCMRKYGKYSFHSHANRENFLEIFKTILEEVNPEYLICRHTDGCQAWEADPQEVIDYMTI